MTRYLFIFFVFCFFSCGSDGNRGGVANEKPAVQYVKDLQHENDSLRTLVDSLSKFCDSLKVLYNGQIMTCKITELQIKRYAKIVKNNPRQAIFLEGWIDRAFRDAIGRPLK